MAASNFHLASIVKLKGRENFIDWQFAVEAYPEHEGLFEYVNGTVNEATFDVEKDKKTRAKIILLIEPINYVHIRDCRTSKEVWSQLQSTFQDSGIYRRIAVIRQLTSTKLENCTDIEDYVNKIINAAHKLRNIDGNNVSDEWTATFLLAGLSDRYKPMIMALESSNIKLTSDAIKTKLLQETKTADPTSRALFSRNNHRRGHRHNQQNNTAPTSSDTKPNSIRCYTCQEVGHISKNCPKKKKNVSGKQTIPNFSPSDANFTKRFWILRGLFDINTSRKRMEHGFWINVSHDVSRRLVAIRS